MFDEGTLIKHGEKSYRIDKELTMGEFAVSYKASLITYGTTVFLKKYIDPTPLLKDEYTAFVRHQQNVRDTLNSMSSSFEKILDDFEYGHHYFVVKPFYPAKPLEKWIFEEHSEAELLSICLSLTRILKEMDTVGLIHFDLKTPQIMVFEQECQPILCDFDFSVIKGTVNSRSHKAALTPFYFSPEHLKKSLDAFAPATNVFLMGQVLFEVLTRGRKAHICEDMPQYKQALVDHKVHRVRSIRENVLPAVDELVHRCLAPRPADRPSPADLEALFAAGQLFERAAPKRTPAAAAQGAVKAAAAPTPAPTPKKAPPAPAVSAKKAGGRIELRAGSSLPLSIWEDTLVGRDQMRIFGDERKYVDKQQFRIFPAGGGWKILHLSTATNKTKLDGSVLGGAPVALNEGSEIQVGPLKLQVHLVG